MNIVDFLHGDIHQEEVVFEVITFGCVCPGIPSHAQTCLDLPRVSLGNFRGIARLIVN